MRKLHVEDEGWFGQTADLVWWPSDFNFGYDADRWVPLAGRCASYVFSSGMATKCVSVLLPSSPRYTPRRLIVGRDSPRLECDRARNTKI